MRYRLALIGILGFGLSQALLRAGGSLQVDEPFTANVIHLPWADMLSMLWRDSTMPLHYILLKVWAGFFGESEFALRSLSILCFGATILILAEVGRRAEGDATGLIAAALFALSVNIGQIYGVSARMYALLMLLVALTLLLLVELFRLGGHLRSMQVVLLILLNILGVATHFIFAFFILGYLIAIGLWARSELPKVIFAGALSSLIYAALTLPNVSFDALRGAGSWLPPPQILQLLQGYLYLWSEPSAVLLIALLSAILFYGALHPSALPPRRMPTQPRLALALIIAVSSLVPFFSSQLYPMYHSARTPSLYLPVMCVALALIFRSLVAPRLVLGILTTMALISVGLGLQYAASPELEAPRTSVERVIAAIQCTDTLIMGGLSSNEVEYYWRRLNGPLCVRRLIFPASLANHPGWMDVPTLFAQPSALIAEAQATLRSLAMPNARVWLVIGTGEKGYGHVITAFLKDELDQNWQLDQKLDVQGSFFNLVLVYRPR